MSESTQGTPKNFDPERFEDLCRIQCTAEEIAAVFGITVEALGQECAGHYSGRSLSDVCAEKRAIGVVTLRRALFDGAANGDPALLVWAGTEYLTEHVQSAARSQSIAESHLARLFQLASNPTEESLAMGAEIITELWLTDRAAHRLLTNCVYESSRQTLRDWVFQDAGIPLNKIAEFSEWLTREGGLLVAPVATERVS